MTKSTYSFSRCNYENAADCVQVMLLALMLHDLRTPFGIAPQYAARYIWMTTGIDNEDDGVHHILTILHTEGWLKVSPAGQSTVSLQDQQFSLELTEEGLRQARHFCETTSIVPLPAS